MTDWLITSPRLAALRILEQRFADEAPLTRSGDDLLTNAAPDGSAAANAPVATVWRLADWQAEAVSRAEQILRRRGGVLIADSVGLGKTHIGAALIARARVRGLRCAIIAPSPLRAHWRRTLHDASVRLFTHAQLSRSHGAELIASTQFIVIDEAHAFRNRNTRRYRALMSIRGRAEVVLLTATPVNNSATDLLNLLSLFAREDAFRDIGVPSLTSVFHAGDSSAIAGILAETTIRRTRAFVRRHYGAIVDHRGTTLRFPDREDPVVIGYDLADVYADAWPRSLELIQELELAWLRAGTRELLRLTLLKRFESSTHAFATSIAALGAFVDAWLEATRTGHALSPIEYRRFFRDVPDQMVLSRVLLRAGVDRTLDLHAVRRDRARIAKLRRALSLPPDSFDPKLSALSDVLRRETGDAPAIVFTTFRDTARYLWRALRNEFRTALIDGQDACLGAARASRTSILRALSPGARVHDRERVDILIATDVLSEGLDLHAARTVISYDLPWNPIRIVQRVGRIDRPGSPHTSIRIVNFIPDRGLDRLLDLLSRIRTKLDAIRMTIGLEAPVLDRGDVDPDTLRGLLHRLAAGDIRALDDDPDDILNLNEQLRQEWNNGRGELRLSCDELRHPCDEMTCDRCDRVAASIGSGHSIVWRHGRLFVIRSSDVVEDPVAASHLLLDALRDTTSRPVEADRLDVALARAEYARAAIDTIGTPDGGAARATRLLLSAVPRLSRPEQLARLESMVRSLRAPLPPSIEHALAGLVSDPPPGPAELLDRVGELLANPLQDKRFEPVIVLLERSRVG